VQPETIRTYELAWEELVGRHHRFGLSAYHYRIHGLIDQTPTADPSVFIFRNLARARATGVETEWEGKWQGGWSARASYAWQRAKDGAGLELTSSPRSLGKVNLILPLMAESLSLGVEGQFNSGVTTLAQRRTRSFFLTNVTLLCRRFRGWEMSASAYNVFDVDHDSPGAGDHLQDVLPQEGRSLRLKLSRSF
jgi:iron complex outermembrane receptor protein